MDMLRKVHDSIKLDQRTEYAGKSAAWINRDIVPLPPSRRTWGSWSFVGYWMLTGINASTWTNGSGLLAIGLNVWQAIISVIVGALIVSAAIVFNGYVGAEWHVPFPVYNRFVWGVYGSFLPLLMRILLSIVWYGVQLVFGGMAVKVVIGSIWPSFYTLHNTLPESSGIELNTFIGLIIFAGVSFPLLLVPPEHYRKPFVVGSVMITITAISIFIWALAKEGGGGPLLTHPSELSGVLPLSGGTNIGWSMAYGVSAVIGGISAGIMNMSDYTRFASYPRAQIISQVVTAPAVMIISALVGIIVTSCAAGFYPDEPLLWLPFNLLTAIQTHGGPGARAAVFFAGSVFIVSQFGINLPGNGISGGIDMSGLLPRYINIWRGAWITGAIGIAICPWHLLSSGSTFLTVLSSFSVFIGPLTGCMICDYILVRKRMLRLTHLYTPNETSIYWYTYGINFRTVASWLMGVWPLMPGFIAAVSGPGFADPTGALVPIAVGWTRLYNIAWPLGFTISFVTHAIINRFFPPVGLGETDPADVFGTFGPPEASDEFGTMPHSDFHKDGTSSTEDDVEKKGELV